MQKRKGDLGGCVDSRGLAVKEWEVEFGFPEGRLHADLWPPHVWIHMHNNTHAHTLQHVDFWSGTRNIYYIYTHIYMIVFMYMYIWPFAFRSVELPLQVICSVHPGDFKPPINLKQAESDSFLFLIVWLRNSEPLGKAHFISFLHPLCLWATQALAQFYCSFPTVSVSTQVMIVCVLLEDRCGSPWNREWGSSFLMVCGARGQSVWKTVTGIILLQAMFCFVLPQWYIS